MKKYIDALVGYALSRGLIGPGDEIYAYNALLAALELDAAGGEGTAEGLTLAEILSALTDDAVRRGVIDGGEFSTPCSMSRSGCPGVMLPHWRNCLMSSMVNFP